MSALAERRLLCCCKTSTVKSRWTLWNVCTSVCVCLSFGNVCISVCEHEQVCVHVVWECVTPGLRRVKLPIHPVKPRGADFLQPSCSAGDRQPEAGDTACTTPLLTVHTHTLTFSICGLWSYIKCVCVCQRESKREGASGSHLTCMTCIPGGRRCRGNPYGS